MSMQLLVSAVNAQPREMVEAMNIHSDAIVVNQCDRYDYTELEKDGYHIRFFSMNERGVGLSRNHALLRADHEISLFADEDIIYVDDYKEQVEKAFREHPKADMILFYVKAAEGRETYTIEKEGRVRWYNCGRYPTYSFGVRTERVHALNISFHLLFGGGAPYSNGEDSLFIMECIRKGMQVIKVPVTLGHENGRESTWFKGYNRKFFYDRGVLYHFLYGPLKYLMGLRFLLAHKGEMCRETSVKQAYAWIKEGIRDARHLGTGKERQDETAV